jgi:uncharacterized hydrophobic protein (TIGR00271 family)
MVDVAQCLRAIPRSHHVIRTADAGSGHSLVSADLEDDAVDMALAQVKGLGVLPDDVALMPLESLGPVADQQPVGSVMWADLLSQADANASPVPRYLAFMAMAGIIAAFSVIYEETTLLVGAMAISPDTLPITAAATAVVVHRWRLAGRALVALVCGLGLACLVGGVMTFVLNAFSLLPKGFDVGHGGFLSSLSTVNISTPLVALAAGIAGMLALETRASSAVGVAISVTTIPASAYLGVAAGLGETAKAAGALVVLTINVAMLLVGGSVTLLAQRALARRTMRALSGPD